jgi:hypothetical protein
MSSAAIPVAAESAAAKAGRSVTCAGSTPTFTTSVGVNSGAPAPSVIGARSGRLRVSSRRCPSPSSGWIRPGAETTRQASSTCSRSNDAS